MHTLDCYTRALDWVDLTVFIHHDTARLNQATSPFHTDKEACFLV
jgi:hypothetical protein